MTVKLLFKHCCLFLSALLFSLNLAAQCSCAPCSNGAIPFDENSDILINIEVSDAGGADCNLSSNSVLFFNLAFSHSFLGDVTATLTSPTGQSVTLIGGSGDFGVTDDGINNPDVFKPIFRRSETFALHGVWENNAVSQKTNNTIVDEIVGDYYPASGQINDFSNGTLCGTWQLRISDNLTEDEGFLDNFGLRFTNTDNLNCPVNTSLAAELLEFRAFAAEKNNVLEWLTATETDTKWHIVERAENGRDFKEFGRVAAQGTTSQATTYRFEDTQPLVSTYYRVKTLGTNGAIEYSHIVKVDRKIPQLTLQKIYPSPTQGQTTVEFNVPEDSKIQSQLINISGQVLQTNFINTQAGNHKIEFDLSTYAPGLYYFVLSDGQQRVIKKIVKQ